MKKILNLTKLFFGWPLSVLAIFFLFQKILAKSGIIKVDINSLNVQLLIYGIASLIIYFFLRSIVWREILKAKGHFLPLNENIYLWASSELKRYIPGNIWSILGRAILFSEKGIHKKTIASSMVIEIQFFLLSNFILSLFASSFVLYNFLPKILPTEVLRILLIIFTIMITLFLIFNKAIIDKYLNKNPFTLLKHVLPNFSPKVNLFLLILSLIYSFFFGLGTYLAISSIIFLTPAHVFTLTGIFVLSLLIGYLSFITPMGLGIREAAMTFGLSKFISLNLAGIAAIYARVVLVFSEIIFVILAFLYCNLKHKLFANIEKQIKTHKYLCLLLFLTLVYALYFTNVSIARHDNFYTGRFDLGNMDQTIWNTLRGRIFQLTNPDGIEVVSRLAFHADFILILLTPLYLIWPDPRILLVFQTIVLGFGSIFVFLIAKHVLKNEKISFLVSFAYLLNPLIQHANLFDFHAVSLATTFLLAVFYFFITGNHLLFLLFSFLAAITKEQVWITISLFGFWAYLKSLKTSFLKIVKNPINNLLPKKENYKAQIIRIFFFIFCLSIFYYLVNFAIPNTRGSQHFALSYYSDFGNSPMTVVKNMIFSPQKIIGLITQNGHLNYLYQIFLPSGFLVILAPQYLIFALPDLLINLLSNNSQLRQIYFQYNSNIVPFIFISIIYGIKNIKRFFPKIPLNYFGFFLLGSTLFSAILLGPLPGTNNPNLDMFTKPQVNKDEINGFINHIPKKFSIASTNNLGAHLSDRKEIFTIPIGVDKADIVMFLLNDPFAQPSLKKQKEMVEKLKKDKNYIEVFKQNDFIVFEKRNLYLQPQPKTSQVKLFPLSIPALQHRDYVGGKIETENKIFLSNDYSSFIISYSSDALKLYALMNIPNSPKPENGYPILILNHGYINPKEYNTVSSYEKLTDFFSSHGFLVLKPDFRGNGMSETDDAGMMRFAYPIDVLNLISSLDQIPEADKNQIYLFGHSMGGEITLKVLEVIGKNKEISLKTKAAVVWAPVTDTVRWFKKSHLSALPEAKITPYPYQKTFEILGDPEKNPKMWQSLSPLSYLSDINVPVQVNHGLEDSTVPYEWSIELYDNLISLNKKAMLNLYPDTEHNLSESWSEASENALNFFKKNSK